MNVVEKLFWDVIIYGGIAAGGWLFGKLIMMTFGFKY